MVVPVDFGVALDFGLRDERLDDTLDSFSGVLERAEALGFVSVVLGESFPRRGQSAHLGAPLMALAALSQRTRLKLGTGVTLLPMWHPIRLAYETAILDQLSGGRVILGIGAGQAREWARWGVERSTVGDFMDETLAALKAVWSGEPGYQGRIVSIEGGVAPLPIQPGGPPIWVGGAAPRSARRAATYGDGWYGSTQYPISEVGEQVGRYHRALEKAGKTPQDGTVASNRLMYVAETDEQAMREGWPALKKVLDMYIGMGALKDTPDLPERVCLVGSPETVRVRIGQYAALGVEHFQLRAAAPDLSIEQITRSLSLFGEQVLPAFR